MRTIFLSWIISVVGFSLGGFFSSAGAVEAVPMHHSGYLSEVESERVEVHRKLRVVAKPAERGGPEWKERIFTARLKKEFKEKYREKFGRTNTENLINSPSQYVVYDGFVEAGTSPTGLGTFRGNYVELHKENQKFGSFMFRRLTEYHVDQYMRDKPVVQRVYEMKEKYSKVNLQISKKVKLKVRYQISENSLRLQLDNPWIKNKWLIEMDSAALGPSEVKESTVSFYFPRILGVAIQTHYKAIDESYLLVGSRRLTSMLTANFTAHRNRRLSTGPFETDFVRENLYIGGLSWVY